MTAFGSYPSPASNFIVRSEGRSVKASSSTIFKFRDLRQDGGPDAGTFGNRKRVRLEENPFNTESAPAGQICQYAQAPRRVFAKYT